MRTRWILTLVMVLAMLRPGAALAEGAVFYVAPSGGDDTAALEEALALAQAAGPDSVVELEAGVYSIAHPIVMLNWSGTLRGQGKDATTLRNGVNPFPGIELPEDAYGPFTGAMLLRLRYDDGVEARVQVEGFAFRPTGLSAVPGAPTIQPINLGTGYRNTYAHVDATFTDLDLRGDVTTAGIVIIRNSGDVTVTDTVMSNMSFGIIGVTWQGGSLSLGGQRPADRVTLKDLGMAGIFGFGSTGTAFEITNVVAENVGVVYQQQALSGGRVHMSGVETTNAAGAVSIGYFMPLNICPTAPSTYVFEHNTIRVPEGAGWAGFVAMENCEVKSQYVIGQNRIESALTDNKGPILLNGTRGAVVTNNLLSGTGLAGISLGLFGGDDSGALLKGNALQGFEGMVGVLLAAATHDNTVVGGGNLRALVWDEDDNPDTPEYEGDNILSGVNSAGGAIGAAIREAMRSQREARQLFR